MPVHRNPPPFFHRLIALLPCALMAAAPLHAQEQVDLGDRLARGSGAVTKLTFRISLVGAGNVKSVRSHTHGALPVSGNTVTLPQLDAIDLLFIE